METKILNDRYELREILGMGGMAVVYNGYDRLLSRKVAIKILKDSFVENEDVVNKLKLEAQASASIIDDNIVSIYDVGTTEYNSRQIEYIVMEKVEGKTLKEIITNEAPLSFDKIINYTKQISKALQSAHRNGLVHRDIKPANILITEDDKVKVTDFGIARVSSDATLTYTSSILGTVHYISPEQAKGQTLDERSDLYSLGIVMYEMMTGKVPFDGESPVSIAVKHIQENPESIKSLIPDANDNLIKIIRKLLQKDPENRYKTASNLLIDIDRVINGVSIEDFENINNNDKLKDTVKQKVSYKMVKPKDDNTPVKKKGNLLKIVLILFAILSLVTAVFFVADYFMKEKERSRFVTMPSVVDISEDSARQTLENLGLIVHIKERKFDEVILQGNVIEQSVKQQRTIEKGSIVELTISKGKELVKVPMITGFDIRNIEQLIKDNALTIGERTEENSDKPKGQIIAQLPQAGEMVEKGSKIDLVLSLGPKEKKVAVPSVEDFDQNTALTTLRLAGLIPNMITKEYSDTVRENNVISQSISPGTQVEEGTEISIVISLGREPETPKETETEVEVETPSDTIKETETEKETEEETVQETIKETKKEGSN